MSTFVTNKDRDQGIALVDVTTLKPSALLADVPMADAASHQQATKLYRCALVDLGFRMHIRICGLVFASDKAGAQRWDGMGDDAAQVRMRGTLVRLTEDEVARLKKTLPYHWLRPNQHPADGTVLGYEHVDSSDADPVNPRPGRTQLRGDEIPIRNVLVFECVDSDPKILSTLTAERITKDDLKKEVAEAEREEAEDLHATSSPGSQEAKRLAAKRTKLQKDLSVATLDKPGSAGVIG